MWYLVPNGSPTERGPPEASCRWKFGVAGAAGRDGDGDGVGLTARVRSESSSVRRVVTSERRVVTSIEVDVPAAAAGRSNPTPTV
jgi:hypothetical protein